MGKLLIKLINLILTIINQKQLITLHTTKLN
jgi:hypothetical protein